MKPYGWQREKMIDPLVEVFRRESVGILAACTGSGKTLTALCVARELGRTPLVVAPKVTLPSWLRHSEATGIAILDAVNIEKAKTGNTAWLKKFGKNRFQWMLDPEKHMLVIDEAHTVTGLKSQNAEVAKAARQLLKDKTGNVYEYSVPALLMSATLADSPIKLGNAVGYLLGFHRGLDRDGYQWMRRHGVSFKPLLFPMGPQRLRHLEKLHTQMFPRFGVSLKHADIPGFPKNSVVVETVECDKRELAELCGLYDKYDALESEAKRNESALEAMLRARQKSELVKLPSLVEKTADLVEEGMSVVVFLSFRETFDAFVAKTKRSVSRIYGGQSEREREREVAAFMRDETRICVCMIQAGGVGVDLNDVHGIYPRASVMSPPVSAVHYVQALGRIHRANSKTPAIQYMLLAKDTPEERIAARLRGKIDNINRLQDKDLWT